MSVSNAVQPRTGGKLRTFVQDLRKNRVYLCLLIPAIAYVLIFPTHPWWALSWLSSAIILRRDCLTAPGLA